MQKFSKKHQGEREREAERRGLGRVGGRLAAKQVHTLPRIDPVAVPSSQGTGMVGQGRKCVSLLRVKAENLPVPRFSLLPPLSLYHSLFLCATSE